MADVTVRAPDGAIVDVPEAEYEKALRAGYTNVSQEEADAALQEYIGRVGLQAAAAEGLVTAPEAAYSPGREALAKGVSSATFGLGGLSDPASQLTAQRFQTEQPAAAFAAEVAGQLPAAILTGGLGEGAVGAAAGLSRLGRAGVRAADFAAQAAVGGAQTEAEAARVEGREFSATNAAVAGVIGEAFGRTAGLGFSAAIGARRNLIARAEQRAVAQDTADSLSRGGFLNDFRVAAHADQYQNELSKLAADDLDALEKNFAEVSRQDRKRARITRVVEDRPAEQNAVRMEALGEMQRLYEALYTEIGEGAAPAPARQMLNQLRERMDLLADRPAGARLWRQLDENRQALQDYAQDLHQAYENAPGSAWLSREALGRLDAAERVTRETLLREDVWGTAAAREQAAYNVPFHTKYFPTVRTVRGKLMMATATDARGFPVFRGDPGRVRSFFTRPAGDVDSARLGEQFRDYLDGVEAIARAGERDTPAASRNTLEAVRRLRKATAHAEFIQTTAQRMGRRADVAEVGLGVGAGIAGAATGGVAGVAAGGIAGQTVRGLRLVHWLSDAARRLGWAGSPESMAAMLSRGELPRRFGPDTPETMLDDLVVPGRGPSEPPPSGGAGPGGASPGGGGPGGRPSLRVVPGGAGAPRGPSPSMLADARRGSWAPSEPPRGGAGPTPTDELAPEPDSGLAAMGRESRAERAQRPTIPVGERLVGRGQREVEELDPLRETGLAGRREAARLQALTEGEFRDVVRQVRASEAPGAGELAERLEAQADQLRRDGLVVDGELESARGAPDIGEAPSYPPRVASLDDVDDISAAMPTALEVLRANPDGMSRGELEDALGLSHAEGQALFLRLRDRGEVVVRDGLAYAASASASPAGQAARQAFQEMGIDLRLRSDRLDETLATVFGDGEAPTPEQWRRIIPLDTLKQLGPVGRARVDVLGDALIWSAEGAHGITGPYRAWDGEMMEGGLRDEAWRISRTFSRDDAGRLEVHHDHFFVRGDLQGSGVGAQVLKDMMAVYREIGVDVVTVDSIEVGKYFWPSIGFNHPDPAVVQSAIAAYKRFLQSGDAPLSAAEAAEAVKGIKSLPALAQAEFGKEFLLKQTGPWNHGLRLELKDENPLFHLMRGRLDIAAAGLAALGAGQLEPPGEPSQDGNQPAAAGVGGAAGSFAAASALFNRSSARLVANAARRLFSLTAEPALKATARLAYSRSQLERRRDELTQWHQNPEAPGGLIERVSEGFRDAPPEAFAQASAASFRALNFLRGRLPQSGRAAPIAANRGMPVSSDAAAKYARYEQAALYPGDAIREASESGYLSTELLETLEELYPELLAELRVAAYQAVQDAGPRQLSIQAKTQYARLFDGHGDLADPTFSEQATRVYAAAYEQAAHIHPPKTGAGPRPGVSQTAAAVQAPRPWQTG